MKIRQFVFLATSVALTSFTYSSLAQAAIIIKTSQGMGADAELREDDINLFTPGLGQPGSPLVRGTNRGNSNELATRVIDDVTVSGDGLTITNAFPTNDRSSVMYMKFDLSTLPASTHNAWNNMSVKLRLYARNNNNIQTWATKPGGVAGVLADFRPAVFSLKGLDPNGTYSTAREDRLGNDYTATQYAYNWSEGTGNDANSNPTGISYYNAPGIQPHCISPGVGVCNDANIPGSNDTAVQTLGKYDDFDSNVVTVDNNWHWPNETEFANYSTTTTAVTFPGGTEITNDSAGVKDLVFAALQAYENGAISSPVVTFIAHLGVDPTANKPLVGRPSETPGGFLNRNYLVVPKEWTTGAGGTTNINNTDGSFNPALIFVPEPTSASLVALGLMIAAGFARRRRS